MFAETFEYFHSFFRVYIIFWIEFSSRISSVLGCAKPTLMFANFGKLQVSKVVYFLLAMSLQILFHIFS